MSMQFGGPRRPSGRKKEADPLQKPVKKNPKYAHVNGKLYTGATVKNRQVKFDTSGEIFKRVRTSTVYRMLARRETEEESIYRLGSGDTMSVMTERTTMSHAAEEKKLASLIEDWDLLLLDVRPAEEFAKGHIVGSESFPLLRLRRDQMLPSLYSFKNKRGKVIVLYDDDGYSKLGIDMATTLIRKGFENTLLMSGGISKFAHFFPGCVKGEAPLPAEEDHSVTQHRAARAARAAATAAAASASAAGSDSRPNTSSSVRSSTSYMSAKSQQSRRGSSTARPEGAAAWK